MVRGGQLHRFLAWLLHVNRLLMSPKLGGERHLEAEEIRQSSRGFWPSRSWKLHALCCTPCVARLVFFLCLWRGSSAKWGINRSKLLQNHSRQHRKTKVSELYSSDCHEADVGDEMFRFANL